MEPISVALTAAATKVAAPGITKLVAKHGAEAWAKLATKFEGCFQGHVESVYDRCSKMKNIIYKDNAVDFMSQYVGVELSLKSDMLRDESVLEFAKSGNKLLVSGTAGAGKTMFLRWATLEMIEKIKDHGMIPLYLEMRYFQKEYASRPIEQYIFESTSSEKDAATMPQFVEGLKAGMFVIVLDAVDEVSPELREGVVNGFLRFFRAFPKCGVIISSRPDEKLESVQEFMVFRTQPMNKNQIISVIRKIEYDADVKNKLIDRLNNGLYESLSEFLSNPLLATIMLLSFDYSADIPSKLTSFYQQAFEALYQRHDAAKGAYKRELYAGLPMDRFQTIFSTFSFQTYLNYKFEFSDVELLEAFASACAYNDENIDPALVIKDSMESICVIQREGLDNVFSHRSFQEYFCALFVSKYRESDIKEIIEEVASMESRSNVLKMLVEIAPEVFEYEFLLEKLKDFSVKFRRLRLNTKSGFGKFFSAFCSSVRVNVNSGTVRTIVWNGPMFSNPSVFGWLNIAERSYGGSVRMTSTIFQANVWEPAAEGKLKSSHILSRVNDLENRVIKMPQDDEEELLVLEVTPRDADWLIHSDMPKIFERIREDVLKHLDFLENRRVARRNNIKALIDRPRRRFSEARKR